MSQRISLLAKKCYLVDEVVVVVNEERRYSNPGPTLTGRVLLLLRLRGLGTLDNTSDFTKSLSAEKKRK
jgi:hypothetical protein